MWGGLSAGSLLPAGLLGETEEADSSRLPAKLPAPQAQSIFLPYIHPSTSSETPQSRSPASRSAPNCQADADSSSQDAPAPASSSPSHQSRRPCTRAAYPECYRSEPPPPAISNT